MIFSFSNSKVPIRYEAGTFVSPESRNICISRMFAGPDARDPRVPMSRTVIHGSAGVPWQLHSPLPMSNPCFHRRDPVSRSPWRGGPWLTRAAPGEALPAVPARLHPQSNSWHNFLAQLALPAHTPQFSCRSSSRVPLSISKEPP